MDPVPRSEEQGKWRSNTAADQSLLLVVIICPTSILSTQPSTMCGGHHYKKTFTMDLIEEKNDLQELLNSCNHKREMRNYDILLSSSNVDVPAHVAEHARAIPLG